MAREIHGTHQASPDPNQLTELPDWLGNLTALTELRPSGNQLTGRAGLAGEPHRCHQTLPEAETS